MQIVLSCESFNPVRIYETAVPVTTREKIITKETWFKINKWQQRFVYLSSLNKNELIGRESEVMMMDDEGCELIKEIGESVFDITSNVERVMYFSLIRDKVLKTVFRA